MSRTTGRMGTAGGRRTTVLEHLPWRITGLLLLGVLVVIYQPEQGGTIGGLLIPVAMAVAAWMLVQNLLAVALGAGLLAALHSDLGSANWIAAVAYPALAAVSAVLIAAVLAGRFRRHIAATHDARWEQRRQSHEDEDS